MGYLSLKILAPNAIFILQDKKRLPGRFLAAFTGAILSRLS
jgi:hypothetical protein